MLREIVEQIEQLKAQLAKLQPIGEGNAQRLQKKFRLEWNYNSNHIEGNTLTYGETELLLYFDETRGNHEFREYDEMKGHDVALKMVEDLAKDKERDLTEAFIRELNQVILKEPFYKEAETSDGQPTRKLIVIGKYKQDHNSVRLQNGEMFHYASPTDTPIKMAELIEWYRSASTNTDLHPVVVAAELHYQFVLIHPFDDGNGRISRLLMNYHLLRNDYPPVIIKSAEKKDYLRALHDADTGNMPSFVQYIAEQLLWSYEISIKAAKGESVDELGDWEKKIELLKKNIPANAIANKTKSDESLKLAWQNCLSTIFEKLLKDLVPINGLFDTYSVRWYRDNSSTEWDVFQAHFSIEEALNRIFNRIISSENGKLVDGIKLQFLWNGYKYANTNTFNFGIDIDIFFSQQKYSINFAAAEKFNIEVLYSYYWPNEEIESLVNQIKDFIYSEIEKRAKQ